MKRKLIWLSITLSLLVGGIIYTNYTEAQTATPTKPTVTQQATATKPPIVKATASKKTVKASKPVAKTEVTVTYQKNEVLADGTTRSYPMQSATVEVPQDTPDTQSSVIAPIVEAANKGKVITSGLQPAKASGEVDCGTSANN